jgi:hypothetical protein
MLEFKVEPTWAMTTSEFVKAKEEVSQDIKSQVFDDEDKRNNIDGAYRAADWLNMFGSPWWNCHLTGKRCSI